MGFWDRFNFLKRKDDILALDEGKMNSQKTVKDEEEPKIGVQIRSRANSNNGLDFTINMISDGNYIPVGIIKNGEEVPVKRIAKKLENAINPLVEAKNEYRLTKARDTAKEALKRIADENSILLESSAIQFIEQYSPQSMLDYKELDKLPKTIDWENIPESEKYKKAKMLSNRLEYLQEKIKSPEEAFNDKENIVSFMRQTENLPSNPIVVANEQLKDGKVLDEQTLLEVAKWTEKINSNSQEGALYSIYLKLEEKRIWKQVAKKLASNSGYLKR